MLCTFKNLVQLRMMDPWIVYFLTKNKFCVAKNKILCPVRSIINMLNTLIHSNYIFSFKLSSLVYQSGWSPFHIVFSTCTLVSVHWVTNQTYNFLGLESMNANTDKNCVLNNPNWSDRFNARDSVSLLQCSGRMSEFITFTLHRI